MQLINVNECANNIAKDTNVNKKLNNDQQKKLIDENNNNNDEIILFKSENNVNYKLSLNNLTAEVVESKEASGDVLIPKFVEYQSKQFNVTAICDEAFKDSSIESIIFPIESNIQQIGNFAFDNSPIHKLFIPKSLVKLSKQWAQGAKELSEVEIDENNSYFSNETGFLFYLQQDQNNKKSREILFAPRNFEGQFVIPDDVASIGRFAFSQRKGLLSVESEFYTPKKIKSFGFFKCDNLIKVALKGQSDLLLGGCCFSQSGKLLSVDISSKTIVVGKNCFDDCSSLKNVNLNATEHISLGTNAFRGCSGLESIMIFKVSSIKIGDECFADSVNLKSATFVANSVALGNDIIKNCLMLSNITIESADDLYITPNTFGNCHLKFIKLGTSGTLKLNNFCFNSTMLENIEFSFKDIAIGKNCFSKCPSLSTITLQSDDEIKICNELFEGCESLKQLTLASKSKILIVDHFMNGAKKLEVVEINGKNVNIEKNCFNNCQSLTHFIIKKSGETEFQDHQFIDCNKLETILIQSSILNIKQNQICNYKSLKNIYIKSDSQISFGTNCFSGYDNLENVSISSENVNLEENSFKNCPNLNRIHFYKTTNLKIGSNVFHNCPKLTEIDFKTGSNLICEENCFHGSAIEKASFESKYVCLEKNCFENHLINKNVISIINVKGEKVNIGESCFSNCSLLKKFSISSAKIIKIGQNALEKCNNLESISFNVEDKIKISESCFSKCSNLKSFTAVSSKDIILGKTAFEECSNLEIVDLKAGNKIFIFDNCFINAKSLKTFEFSCIEAIFGSYCFFGCLSIANFANQSTNKIIFSRQVFDCCDNLKNIEITTKSEFQANDYCFDRLPNLTNVVINSPKVKIGDFCFNSCVSLSTLSFPNVEEFIYYNSYLLDCINVNVNINPNAVKKEIKSEKLEEFKPYINYTS